MDENKILTIWLFLTAFISFGTIALIDSQYFQQTLFLIRIFTGILAFNLFFVGAATMVNVVMNKKQNPGDSR